MSRVGYIAAAYIKIHFHKPLAVLVDVESSGCKDQAKFEVETGLVKVFSVRYQISLSGACGIAHGRPELWPSFPWFGQRTSEATLQGRAWRLGWLLPGVYATFGHTLFATNCNGQSVPTVGGTLVIGCGLNQVLQQGSQGCGQGQDTLGLLAAAWTPIHTLNTWATH